MSGIAGIFDKHRGSASARRPIDAMLAQMAHRGADGRFVWQGPGIALGHALNDTTGDGTPGLLHEDGLVVTADCRLDNRDDLINQFGSAGERVSDTSLILAAYRRWGEDCAAHLEGDFAFVIWDAIRRRLFGARDRFGVKPFYYHVDDYRFEFASEIRPVQAVISSAVAPDEAEIAAFLAGCPQDVRSTAYVGIARLPARHCLSVTSDGLNVRQYWSFEPKVRTSRKDTAEEFRDLFTRAVRNRMHGTSQIGAMLSGGLDSSSICSVAQGLRSERGDGPLATFSLVFGRTSPMDEEPHIRSVLAGGNYEPHFVRVTDYAPFDEMGEIVAEQEGTALAPGLPLTRALYRAARGKGIKVLLNGHGGDEVVSHGYGLLHKLAEQGLWGRLWREARGAARINGESAIALFSGLFYNHRPNSPLTRVARRMMRLSARISNNHREVVPDRWSHLIHPDFRHEHNLVEQVRAASRPPADIRHDEQQLHHWTLTRALVPHAFEVLDKAAAGFGIEPRYPFWDRALIEFCMSLPAEEKLNRGWSRYVMRRAMAGILPPAVQWRHDKIDFKPVLATGIVAKHGGLIADILGRDAERVSQYIDVAAVRGAYDRLVADPSRPLMDDLQFIWRTVSLSIWLRQFEEERPNG